MDFIRPWLAVGSREQAEDAALLQRHRVDAVLSLTPAHVHAGAAQCALAVRDREPLPGPTIVAAVAFLRVQQQRGHRVLVHCEMGISRSPALVAAFLHEHEGLELDEALVQIAAARPVSAPHPALLDSLRSHYGPGPVERSRQAGGAR